jgi:hypothetical protein
VFCVFPQKRAYHVGKKNVTLDTLFRCLAWSFSLLVSGESEGDAPLPLHATRAGFAGIKGDAKFFQETFLFSRSYNMNFICDECWASAVEPNLLYTNMLPDAAWRLTRERHEDYLRNTRPEDRSALCMIPGYHRDLHCRDLLHCLYLGVGQDLTASVVVELVQRGHCGATIELGLQYVSVQFQQWCQIHKVKPSIAELTRRNLHWSSSPELPGKGSDCKLFIMFLNNLLTDMEVLPDSWLAQVSTCVWALAHALWTLDMAGWMLTEEEADQFVDSGNLFLACYVHLAADAVRQGRRTFKLRPKLHAFHHIVLRIETRQSLQNPRFHQNFMDEDFVGRMCKLARSTHQRTVAARSLQRWLLMLAVRWHLT